MDWTEALDRVVASTGHERYRALCDEDHPDHLAWRRKIIDKAGGIAPAIQSAADGAIPVADSIALIARMKACPFYSTDASCGCTGGRCSLRSQAIVSHVDCFECLKRYG